MMNWKKGLKLAGLGLMMTAACAGLSGCGGKGEGAGSGKTAKVGFINGVSGGVASYGLAEKEGFDMAVEEINREGKSTWMWKWWIPRAMCSRPYLPPRS